MTSLLLLYFHPQSTSSQSFPSQNWPLAILPKTTSSPPISSYKPSALLVGHGVFCWYPEFQPPATLSISCPSWPHLHLPVNQSFSFCSLQKISETQAGGCHSQQSTQKKTHTIREEKKEEEKKVKGFNTKKTHGSLTSWATKFWKNKSSKNLWKALKVLPVTPYQVTSETKRGPWEDVSENTVLRTKTKAREQTWLILLPGWWRAAEDFVNSVHQHEAQSFSVEFHSLCILHVFSHTISSTFWTLCPSSRRGRKNKATN